MRPAVIAGLRNGCLHPPFLEGPEAALACAPSHYRWFVGRWAAFGESGSGRPDVSPSRSYGPEIAIWEVAIKRTRGWIALANWFSQRPYFKAYGRTQRVPRLPTLRGYRVGRRNRLPYQCGLIQLAARWAMWTPLAAAAPIGSRAGSRAPFNSEPHTRQA